MPENSPSEIGKDATIESLRQQVRQLSLELDSARKKLGFATADQFEMVQESRTAVEHINASREIVTAVRRELRDIRKDLAERNQQLRNANRDLAEVLGCIDMPMVLVEKDLRIRAFTRGASTYLHLEASHTGQFLNEIVNIRKFDRSAAGQRLPAQEEPVITIDGTQYIVRFQWYSAEDAEERALLLFTSLAGRGPGGFPSG